LLLREPRAGDADALWRHLATKEVSRLMHAPPGTPEGFRRFFTWSRREREAGRGFCFAVQPRSEPEPVGLIHVRSLDSGFSIAEWGFCVGASYWGTGLFNEAGRSVIDFLVRTVGTRRLEARVVTSNRRASGALTKLGSRPESILRAAFKSDGQRLDQMLWTVHGDEWLASVEEPVAELEAIEELDLVRDSALSRSPGAEWTRIPPVLVGPGAVLRELTTEDAPLLSELLSARGVSRFIEPPPHGVEGFKKYISWTQSQRAIGRSAALGIVPARHDYAVGIFQLHSLSPDYDSGEWGFALGEPYWGSGLFFQGAELMLHFVFDVVKVRRLEARASINNGRACGALMKVGATPEGLLRRSFLLDDELGDDRLWSIFDDEWRARQSQTGRHRSPAPTDHA
jgi:ribosomal-protein-alanine N-acetyltransferase